jgi:hypothetical protein
LHSESNPHSSGIACNEMVTLIFVWKSTPIRKPICNTNDCCFLLFLFIYGFTHKTNHSTCDVGVIESNCIFFLYIKILCRNALLIPGLYASFTQKANFKMIINLGKNICVSHEKTTFLVPCAKKKSFMCSSKVS